MKLSPAALWRAWESLFEEEGPDEPFFDPIHLAETLIACVVAVGASYWLLWGAMVYEGGLDRKLAALLRGAPGPDAYEGWLGNVLCSAALAVAAGLLLRADRRARPRR